MSVRRLVESLLVTGFDGTAAPDWLLRRLEDGLGGVCWFGQNIADHDQARALADRLHGAREGVLVMTDEEGGEVTRLEAATGSSWPGHGTLGALDDVEVTRAVASQIGRSLRRAGVDIDLAPVVDVNSNPRNPVIGVRSFGSTAELVGRHGAAFVEGLQSVGVAACAKHYPGHGATVVDSHLGLPRVDDPRALLEERDLAPFVSAVRAGARCVMTAHVVFPAFDEHPATMSPVLLDHLRELGFEGVVVSDALDMNAVSRGVGRGEGAVRALAAGVDLICIGNPAFPEVYDAEARLDEIVRALLDAVEEGRLGTARLEQAAERVAALNGWLAEHRRAGDDRGDQRPDAAVGGAAAARAVRVSGDVSLRRPGTLVLDLGGEVNMAAGRRGQWIAEALVSRDPSARVHAIGSPDDVAGALAGAADRPVVVLARNPDRPEIRQTLDRVLAARPDTVVVCTGLSDGTRLADRMVRTSGGGRAVGEAVADVVLGRQS